MIPRLNTLLGTEFAKDIPIDAALALQYCSAWAGRSHDLMGVVGMRKRLGELEKAVLEGPQPRLATFGGYPGTKEIPSPEYTLKDRLGMHLQYLGHLGDPDIEPVLRRWMRHDSAAIRFGCAKAALERGRRDLFKEIIRNEPPGLFQKMMLRCIRNRKKRDFTDKVQRVHDEEFELPAGNARDYTTWKTPTPAELEAKLTLDNYP